MGKISPVSIKYIIRAHIKLTSLADRPDVIGAVFGQTEGLMGPDLELRELQKAGKIGRIEVNLENKGGKSEGEILIPSSMGKSETALVAASVETIDRVGPCNAKIKVKAIEDVRVEKRDFILKRAEELLKGLVDTLPDSQSFTTKVTHSVRTMDVKPYGKDKLPAGPGVDENEDLIVVEGRADVINLLKHGIKNCIALNGDRGSKTIQELAQHKTVTLFVDGDRGGDLIVRRLIGEAEIDFVTKAPDGKEVEELEMKEIQKALRAKIPAAELKTEATGKEERPRRTERRTRTPQRRQTGPSRSREYRREPREQREVSPQIKNVEHLKELSEEIVGTRGAYIIDDSTSILGRVPVSELAETLNDVEGAYAIILDGEADKDIVSAAESKRIRLIVGKGSGSYRVKVIEAKDL